MDRLQCLEIFVNVARSGGFAPAARRLGISPPSATRGVAELEERLGTQLFHRTTRSVRLTDSGRDFLPQAERILADLDQAERSLAGRTGEPRGTLFVTAPVMFGRLHVLPVIGEMIEAHEDLDARLLLVDRNIRIVEEGIDVAVRIGPLKDSSLHAAHIADVRPVLVASPSYLARFGTPRSAADLESHHRIATTGARAQTQWRALGKAAGTPARMQLNTVDSIIAAAEAGLGIASLLSYQVDAALRLGRLVELGGIEQVDWLPVSLLFGEGRARTPAVRLFIDLMREAARREVGMAQ
ncbi:LysR family transcriptional regulator [Altererythrobacter sp.]|uniref:LysR family transcriptional regulator n=1 Tax=Altererythrobacter sp. TaxID=1872480 RepID=UPI003D075CB8